VVTSNSSPEFLVRQASDTTIPVPAQGTYERGLATIPLRTLSRRVHAPVIHLQQSGKRPVMLEISDRRSRLAPVAMRVALDLSPQLASHGLHLMVDQSRHKSLLIASSPLLLRRASARSEHAQKIGAEFNPCDRNVAVSQTRTCPLAAQTNRVPPRSYAIGNDRIELKRRRHHEQRITSHLNLLSDQCRYDHRMRVRGDFRTLAGL
jgi:hypothetical protein